MLYVYFSIRYHSDILAANRTAKKTATEEENAPKNTAEMVVFKKPTPVNAPSAPAAPAAPAVPSAPADTNASMSLVLARPQANKENAMVLAKPQAKKETAMVLGKPPSQPGQPGQPGMMAPPGLL